MGQISDRCHPKKASTTTCDPISPQRHLFLRCMATPPKGETLFYVYGLSKKLLLRQSLSRKRLRRRPTLLLPYWAQEYSCSSSARSRIRSGQGKPSSQHLSEHGEASKLLPPSVVEQEQVLQVPEPLRHHRP